MESKPEFWFWNESINKSNSDLEEKNNDIDERNLEKKHSKIERAVSPEVPKKELKWNKEGESNCCGDYGSGSRLS